MLRVDIMLVILKEIRNGLSLMIHLLWDLVRIIFRLNVLVGKLILMYLMITNGIRLIRLPSLHMFYFIRNLAILRYKPMLNLFNKRICSLSSIPYPKS